MECINEITPFDLSLEKMLEYLNKIFLDFNREFFFFLVFGDFGEKQQVEQFGKMIYLLLLLEYIFE